MKIAVLGAAGRTGREVVDALLAAGHEPAVLTRQSWAGPTNVRVVRGDALDRNAVDALVAGCDAVICALGPGPGSAPDLCTRATEVLITSMRAAGVPSVVAVTGAMVGDRGLGRFYHWLARRPGIAAGLEDRRKQERLLRESGLRWTLVRPPRLTNRPGPNGLRVGSSLRVGFAAAAARADVARVLVRAAVSRTWEGEAVTVLQSLSAQHPMRVLAAWLWRMGFAEMVGLAAVAAVALTFVTVLGIPARPTTGLMFLCCVALAGAAEGALLGLLPGTLIRRVFPAFPLRRFTLVTAAAIAIAWTLGMLPSALGLWPSAIEQPIVVLLAYAAFGAAGGAAMGALQAVAVRGFAPLRSSWVGATALGWAVGLPLSLLAGTVPGPGDGPLASLSFSLALAFGGGVVAGLPTGLWLLWRMKGQERRDAEAAAISNSPHRPLLA